MVWGSPGARIQRNSSWLSFLSFSPCFPGLLLPWDLIVVWSWARVLHIRSNYMPIMMVVLFFTFTLASSPLLSKAWLFSLFALPTMESALPRRLVIIFPD